MHYDLLLMDGNYLLILEVSFEDLDFLKEHVFQFLNLDFIIYFFRFKAIVLIIIPFKILELNYVRTNPRKEGSK